MGVSIGNESHHYYAPPRKASGLAKVGLAAAMLGTGAGLGAAVPLLLGALADRPPQRVETPWVDHDTQYEARLESE